MTAARTGSGTASRTVDPRLQARRRQVARQEGRRRLWIVGTIAAVAAMVVAGIGIANSSWLDVESVTVVGAHRADVGQVTTASGLTIGQPLIEVSADTVADAVARVPWVATAEVKRGWRGAVTIEITERAPLLVAATGSRFVLVDRTGRQLEIVDDPPLGLLPLSGLEASGVPGQPIPGEALAATVVAERLSPSVAQVTSGLAVIDGQLYLELGTGGLVNLGDDRQLDDKMVALETVLAQVDLSCLAVVDVRVPEAPTVRRTNPDAGLEAASGAAAEEPLGGTGGC